MIRKLDIKDTEQIQRLNRVACEAPYEVWLSLGNVMIDARSILGIYSLLGKRVHVVAEDDVNPKHFEKLVARMEQ